MAEEQPVLQASRGASCDIQRSHSDSYYILWLWIEELRGLMGKGVACLFPLRSQVETSQWIVSGIGKKTKEIREIHEKSME